MIRYFQKLQQLKEWKERKRIKWLAEGKTEAEVKEMLKPHKVFFFKSLFKTIKNLWQ